MSTPITWFTKRLVDGLQSRRGILSLTDQLGREQRPFSHQEDFVRRFVRPEVEVLVAAHCAGSGKTGLALMCFAAIHLIEDNACGVFVVPPSLLEQWYSSARDWLRHMDETGSGIADSDLIVPRKRRDLTDSAVRTAKIVILSSYLVADLFRESFEPVEKAFLCETTRRWRSGWRPKPGGTHPLFEREWSFLCVDEVHVSRNSSTFVCQSQAQLSKRSKKRVGLSATPVVTKPSDMVGISTALGVPACEGVDFTLHRSWSDTSGQKLKKRTAELFRRSIDVVCEDVLQLPPLVHEFEDFPANLPPDAVAKYNELLRTSHAYRLRCEGPAPKLSDYKELSALLVRLQQIVVSPLLAERGAKAFWADPALFAAAAAEPTGALVALRRKLDQLMNRDGVARVLVCSESSAMLHIAARCVGDVGKQLFFDGRVTMRERRERVSEFLYADKAVLFLSIGAGGLGLNLVAPKPFGCSHAVFWGARPFSPAVELQAAKRLHRYGAYETVTIHHLISRFSVDDAIGALHSDKVELSKAMMGEAEIQGAWRTSARVVDGCEPLKPNGRFPRRRSARDERGRPIDPEPRHLKQPKRPRSPGA